MMALHVRLHTHGEVAFQQSDGVPLLCMYYTWVLCLSACLGYTVCSLAGSLPKKCAGGCLANLLL
jgi:hypothetical protein